MAKRIKVKGKNPRGLSKSQRTRINAIESFANKRKRDNERDLRAGVRPFSDDMEGGLDSSSSQSYRDLTSKIMSERNVSSRPSSTRKKRVKEGSRKFIGPRQLKTEVAEDADARRLEMIIDRMEELGLPKDMEMARSHALFTKFLGNFDRPIRQSLRGKEARKQRGPGQIEDIEAAEAGFNQMSPNLKRKLYEFLSRNANRG